LRFVKAGLVAFLAALVVAVPAFAGQDIPWTWNSNDFDSKAKFFSAYDNFHAYEYHGTNYIDYYGGSRSGLRWFIPGSDDGAEHTLNENFAEGTAVGMNVCQQHTAFPDDCSGWKTGVS
jgi:hypothetical protein